MTGAGAAGGVDEAGQPGPPDRHAPHRLAVMAAGAVGGSDPVPDQWSRHRGALAELRDEALGWASALRDHPSGTAALMVQLACSFATIEVAADQLARLFEDDWPQTPRTRQ